MTHVYVIQAEGGPVKVGVSADPVRRLASLRTSTPFDLSLVHVEPIAASLRATAVEQIAHRLLDEERLQGEWFNVTAGEAREAVRAAVARLAPPLPSATAKEIWGSGQLATSNQLKAARALIGMDQRQLAEATGLNVNTIRNMEAGGAGAIPGRAANVQVVQRALEVAGVEFTNGSQPGVRLARKGEP